jgi:hypothetical protein
MVRILAVLVAGCSFAVNTAESAAVSPEAIALPVLVTETPGIVRLSVLLPEGTPPGSVEVQVAGQSVVVLAQDIHGGQLRSRSLRLSQAVVEDGAQADFEPDGSLTIRLRARRPGDS